jgi:hypothetical protein
LEADVGVLGLGATAGTADVETAAGFTGSPNRMALSRRFSSSVFSPPPSVTGCVVAGCVLGVSRDTTGLDRTGGLFCGWAGGDKALDTGDPGLLFCCSGGSTGGVS